MNNPTNKPSADDELREQLAQLFYDDNYAYMKSRPDMYDIGAIDEAVELIKKHELQARLKQASIAHEKYWRIVTIEDTESFESYLEKEIAKLRQELEKL